MISRPFFSGSAALVLVAVILIALVPAGTACDPESGVGTFFDEPMAQMAAAVKDDKMYIFGGTNGSVMKDYIQVYDPVQETLTTLDARLPRPMNNAGAFTYGDKIYIFGGTEPGNLTRNENLTIFTPPDKIEVKENFFDHGMEGNSVAQDGKYFYFFGNCICPFTPGRKDAWRFDAESLELKHYPNVLPGQLAGSVAAFYSGDVYIFGGKNRTHAYQDTILKWTPGDAVAEVLSVHLAEPIMKLGLVRVGTEVFLLGGLSDKGMSDNVYVFDLEKQTIKITGQVLTHHKASRACVLIRDTAYLAGGDTPEGPGGGIEVVVLPISPSADDDGSDAGLTRDDLILTLSIIGAGVVILIVIGVYLSAYKKKQEENAREGEDYEEKKPKKGSK